MNDNDTSIIDDTSTNDFTPNGTEPSLSTGINGTEPLLGGPLKDGRSWDQIPLAEQEAYVKRKLRESLSPETIKILGDIDAALDALRNNEPRQNLTDRFRFSRLRRRSFGTITSDNTQIRPTLINSISYYDEYVLCNWPSATDIPSPTNRSDDPD
jgi:hypothetical protein